ncbi:MAG TPA: serine hydrolase domain-containing protein [Streptosporangiaceae bacterium]|nr:serine hydrolase domain-containing protein [Streptosporangiaceae bacterium]
MSVSQPDLQGELGELVAKHRVPGAVVAVWQDGELITATAGLANLNTGVPMTVDTAFLTGSITKVWATTMFMTFVEEGLLDLDVPIVSYAPDIQFGADQDAARSLTFRHLVNHSSGVDSSDLFVQTRPFPEGVEDYLGPLSQAGKLTEPGLVSSYNNAGWIIAELVLRSLTGKNFVEHLDQRVVQRLGLRRTVFSAREAMLHRTAIGSYPASDGTPEATTQFMYPDSWAAPGTMTITTVEDTIAFLRMHLADGVLPDGTRLLSHESIQAMQTPTSPDPTGPDSGFGLGWMYNQHGGARIFSHGGGSLGGVAHAQISPEDNFAMAAFVNSSIGGRLHDELVRLVLPSRPSPLATPTGEIRRDVPLDPFVGKYSRVTMRTEVTRDSDHLVVQVTEVPEELVGVLTDPESTVPEFQAVPINDNTLVSCGELLDGPQALTFHEKTDGAFQLMYTGHRLARRVATA